MCPTAIEAAIALLRANGYRVTLPRSRALALVSLRERRLAAGLGRAALARLASVSVQHLRALETGRRRALPEMAAILAARLGCTVADLCSWMRGTHPWRRDTEYTE